MSKKKKKSDPIPTIVCTAAIICFILLGIAAVITAPPLNADESSVGKNLDHWAYDEWDNMNYIEKVRYVQGYIVGQLGLTYRLEKELGLENAIEVTGNEMIWRSAEIVVKEVNTIYGMPSNRSKPIWYVIAYYERLSKETW